MKKWQALYILENGEIDFDVIMETQAHNPIKAIKNGAITNPTNGFIFREWKKFDIGEKYFEGQWFRYTNLSGVLKIKIENGGVYYDN